MDQNKSLQKIDPGKSLKKLSEDSSLAKRGLRDIGIWPKIEELFEKLKSQYEAEKYQDCIITAEEILKTDSNHFFTLCYYGRSLFHLERYEEALKVFDRCLDEEKDYFYLWSFRGDVFYKIQNYEKAISDYLKSIELDPNNGADYDNVAMCLFLNGEHEKAHEYIDKAIAIETTEDMPMIRKAQFFEFQKLAKEALAQYIKTLNNFPSSEYAKKKAVELLEIQAKEKIGDDNQNALTDIDLALSYDPENANLLSIKAILLDTLGDNEQAKKIINKIKQQDPHNPDLDFIYRKINNLEDIQVKEQTNEEQKVYRGTLEKPIVFPESIIITAKNIDSIDFNKIIYCEITPMGAMGNEGGILIYVLTEKDTLITYEINLEIDEQTFNIVSERISQNADLFINYYGGMGNHVYVKKNTKLEIDEKHNCFWYHSHNTKLKINSSVHGVFLSVVADMTGQNHNKNHE